MDVIRKYDNGNYSVEIYKDGTKIRYISENDIPTPVFPESCDIKITNYCDNPICMKYCHEKSNPAGKHADLDFTYQFLKQCEIPLECAFGGGNTLSHPNLKEFLYNVKDLNHISNITVNQYHFIENKEFILKMAKDDVVKGIGLSITKEDKQEINNMVINENVVLHFIAGINNFDFCYDLMKSMNKPKMLILGYKQFGNGITYHSNSIEDNIDSWKYNLAKLFNLKNLTLSFDNLAVKQLNVRRFFNNKEWNEFYLGDDGKYTMYLDMVKKQYAISSSSKNKNDIDCSFKDVFNKVKMERQNATILV